MFPLSNSRQLVIGAAFTIAFAGAAQSPSIPTIADTAPAQRFAVPAAHQKSVGAAVVISLASTYAPAVLAYATHNSGAEVATGLGLLIGPSTGYWYAGSPKWKSGLIVRTIAAGVGTAGLALIWHCNPNDSGSSKCGFGGGLMIAGGLGVLVMGIVDVARLPNAMRAERVPVLSIAPVVGAGARTAGLSAQLRF